MHDPVMIKEGNTYYIFATTGKFNSTDMVRWNRSGGFVPNASWQSQTVPGHAGYWAPDISYRNGKYWLYYSISTFGEQRSAIGLATSSSLSDPFQDQGMVVRSPANDGDYNAIDANAIEDEEGNVWLSWGSFWDGIFMRQLDPETGKFLDTASTFKIAGRTRAKQWDGIEGPFIIRTRDYFYLFVSWDKCCAGMQSTYNMRIGRSEKVTGPYVDMDGVAMVDGGGTLLDDGTQYAGGHNGVFEEDGQFYVVYHQYTNSGSQLAIRYLWFDEDNWPTFDPDKHSDWIPTSIQKTKTELLLPNSFNYPLAFTPKEDFQFTLYNLQGQSIFSKQLSSNQMAKFPDIKPGSYYSQLNSKKSSYKQQIVVY